MSNVKDIPLLPPSGATPPFAPSDYHTPSFPACLVGRLGNRNVHTGRVLKVICDEGGNVIAETRAARYKLDLMPVDIPELCQQLDIPLTTQL